MVNASVNPSTLPTCSAKGAAFWTDCAPFAANCGSHYLRGTAFRPWNGGRNLLWLRRRRTLEMLKIGRLSGLGAVLALAFGLCGGGAATCAERVTKLNGLPDEAITAIIPFAAGSASDVVSRIMFAQMAKSMGQTIVVENRPGAGGNNGTADAAKAAPDGYTHPRQRLGPDGRQCHAVQTARLRPAERLRRHLAVRQVHDRGRGQQQIAGQHPARPDRLTAKRIPA